MSNQRPNLPSMWRPPYFLITESTSVLFKQASPSLLESHAQSTRREVDLCRIAQSEMLVEAGPSIGVR